MSCSAIEAATSFSARLNELTTTRVLDLRGGVAHEF